QFIERCGRFSLDAVARPRTFFRRGVTALAGNLHRLGTGNGFEDVVEAAVVNTGVWWIDENQLSLLQPLRSLVRVFHFRFATSLRMLDRQAFEGFLSSGHDVTLPSFCEKSFGSSRRLKRLRRVTRGSRTRTGGLNQRSQCDAPCWLA